MEGGIQAMAGMEDRPDAGKAPVPASPALLGLTRAMAAGDEQAFRDFFGLYFHRLFAYLLTVAHGNEDLARDLLQQTMIRVARHVRPFASEDEFWRWLTRLARSRAIDEGRKAGRYFAFLQRFTLWINTPEEAGPEADLDAVLQQELARLPDEERAVLERKYLQHWSVREIAELQGTTEKAVESRLSRARARLKQLTLARLAEEGENE